MSDIVNLIADKTIDTAIRSTMNAMFANPLYPFMVGGQVHLMSCGVEPGKAWDMMKQTLSEFLADNKIAFGDQRYAWDVAAGAEVAKEWWSDR